LHRTFPSSVVKTGDIFAAELNMTVKIVRYILIDFKKSAGIFELDLSGPVQMLEVECIEHSIEVLGFTKSK
jgi:hypothetical protein